MDTYHKVAAALQLFSPAAPKLGSETGNEGEKVR